MEILLFEHNQTAYEAAMAMLFETGKAAVIHPTGTGKSFVGFKLCEEHPDKTVCWLSPSDYIFRTQLENLAKVSAGYQPENIKFYTYAKLMNMSEGEMASILPDYIILDEFHRCGAREWGRGVQALLELYEDVPILGLSATNVRYLDNQRDMADELFDGNIASEMTLGEAIARGILDPPKYVLSVFPYRKDLEKYERRVRAAKSKAVRDVGEIYLEALRRALDKADGMDRIFEKHMEDQTGKYLVFCADHAHLCEMADMVPKWFSGVDRHPHIYRAYSDDPETSRAFAEFKADNSCHLKLLFCIDMLNEGIHVEDISGVILLRPTVSPIIYKQQIGRALAAGKNESAVIFDIVLNIENLYSISAVEEEMQLAVAYYRSLGQSEAIVHEQFQVIDEVRDCRILFDKLQDTLSASWELMYSEAVKYYSENGDLEVPKRYVTANGYTLGSWLATQRLVREGKVKGNLTEAQIMDLDAVGMRWESVRDGVGKALRRGQGLLRGKWASAGQYFPKGLQRRQPRRVDL
jgi:superfamily II DNA or RNA helicase